MRLFTLFGFNELQIVSFDVNHLPYSLDCFPHSLCVCGRNLFSLITIELPYNFAYAFNDLPFFLADY